MSLVTSSLELQRQWLDGEIGYLILPCCRTHRLRTDGEGWGGRGKNQEELTQGVMGGGSQLVGKTGSQRLQRWGSDSISM